MTVLATQAEGQTLVHDWLYELRLFALEQMSGHERRSVSLRSAPDHRHRPAEAARPPLDSRDIRSGMALIAAGLAADGQSRLSPLETVERGYASLIERLRSLGAQVERVESS